MKDSGVKSLLRKYIAETVKVNSTLNGKNRQKLISEAARAYIMERDGVPTGGVDIVDKVVPIKKNPKDSGTPKSERIMVKIFFDKLEKSGLQKYLTFSNVLDQADAIVKFAKIVGVPSNKISDIIDNFRKISANRDTENSDDGADTEVEPIKNPKADANLKSDKPKPSTETKPSVKVNRRDDGEGDDSKRK